MRKRYIGVTDVASVEQAWKLAQTLAEYNLPDVVLMVGLMMSHKTLNGLPTKWSDIFRFRRLC